MDNRTRLFSSVTTTYQARDAAIRAAIERYVRAAWPQDSWRDADFVKFVAAVVPIVESGQQQIAALTNAYLATLETRVFGQKRFTVTVPDVSTEALRGVSADEVWHRPAVQTWTALAAGDTIEKAADSGLARAMSIAATGMQLAKTHTAASRTAGVPGVVGFRRVLTGRENCALCVVASTQRYNKGALLPIHPGCDCGVAEIIGDRDPGQVINRELLDATHSLVESEAGDFDFSARNIGSDTGRDYTHLIVIRDHGEYGPTLAWRDHSFTGPSAVN